MAYKLLKAYYPLLIFCFLFIAYSFLAYKYIPIANGEEFRYLRGKETLEHFMYGQFTEKMLQPRPHYFLYNLYPMFLVFLNPHFYYEWFHLANLLFSLGIFVIAYLFVFQYTHKQSYSIFTLLALVLFPSFFGQLGFNPIDMPFALFYLLSLFIIYKFAGSHKHLPSYQILIFGLVFGITQGLRQLGFTIYIILVSYDLFCSKDLLKLLKYKLFDYILIFLLASFFMIITWPNFAINYLKSMNWFLFVGQDFYLWNYGLLFMGKFLENSERPFYYLPLLQMITYPLYITALFILGLKYLKTTIRNKLYFLIISSISINYLLYFVLKPVLYDGTRHFLFMIPLIVIIAIFHLYEILANLKSTKIINLTLTMIFCNLLVLLFYTFKSFPYNYSYFNILGNAFGNPNYVFESDYSSTLYKSSAVWVRDVYIKDDIMPLVYVCDNGYAVDYYSHKKFITTINKEDADLIICDYKTLLRNTYPGEIIHIDYLNGYPFNYVFKVK